MDRASTVVVDTFFDKAAAQAAVELLAAEGSEATFVADDAGGLLPNLDFARGVRVLVAHDDRERAEALLTPVEDDSD